GFSARKFHELCNDKGATIVVMKVANTGELIGGYNPENWKGGFLGNWTKSLDSFTFSLGVESENLKNSKLSRVKQSHSRMAIFSADVRGPCFGNRDLWMPNYNNLSKKCSSRNSYYEKNIIDSQEFGREDYEVFQ
ncbi:18379_t:CDS:1, partial [Racocetra fulgida]